MDGGGEERKAPSYASFFRTPVEPVAPIFGQSNAYPPPQAVFGQHSSFTNTAPSNSLSSSSLSRSNFTLTSSASSNTPSLFGGIISKEDERKKNLPTEAVASFAQTFSSTSSLTTSLSMFGGTTTLSFSDVASTSMRDNSIKAVAPFYSSVPISNNEKFITSTLTLNTTSVNVNKTSTFTFPQQNTNSAKTLFDQSFKGTLSTGRADSNFGLKSSSQPSLVFSNTYRSSVNSGGVESIFGKSSKSENSAIPSLFGGVPSTSSLKINSQSNKADNSFSMALAQSSRILTSYSDLQSLTPPVPNTKVSKSNKIIKPPDLFVKPQSIIPPSLDKTDKSTSDIQPLKELDKIIEESKKKPPSPQKIKPTTLIAVEIPEAYVERTILSNHFSKFGKVIKVHSIKKTRQASIYFEDHESAANAKAKGRKLHPNLAEMKLFFRNEPTIRRKSGDKSLHESINLAGRLRRPSSREKGRRKDSRTSQSEKSEKNSVTKISHDKEIMQSNKKSQILPLCKDTPSDTGIPKKKVVRDYSKIPSNLSDVNVNRNNSRSSSPSTSRSTSVTVDFDKVSKTKAMNNNDCHLILNARDKKIRSLQLKEVDVEKAGYLSATCPDMCPEKERYTRDIQNDLSSYEITNGKLDHSLVVKKFSRSSADKDEPLPHELRPGVVLKGTLDHLIVNIIDRNKYKNISIDVWYNFLWNRTRAIRNDIMQQHLVDSDAIYILEACVRFHIYCAYGLCEEAPDIFNPRMNNEHLTKSLQSLKEVYYDMAERNTFYDTESEFRSYEILLDVLDGNIMLKYLQFRESVRNSKDVQFAINVLHAIQSNNYVCFFRLVKHATYLQACVMHSYFKSIRYKALKVMIKTYVVTDKTHIIPGDKVMKIFGFLSLNELSTFLSPYGLIVNSNQDVEINKAHFSKNSDIYPSDKKDPGNIDSKMTISLSEIIAGGSLPPNPAESYQPHNSFDSSGCLKESAYDASDQRSWLKDDEVSKLLDVAEEMLAKSDKTSNLNIEETDPIINMSNYVDANERKIYTFDSRPPESSNLIYKPKNTNYSEELGSTPQVEDSSSADLEVFFNERVDDMFTLNLIYKYFKKWRQFIEREKEEKEEKMISIGENVRLCAEHWRLKTKEAVELNRKADKHFIGKYFSIWVENVMYAKEIMELRDIVNMINERIIMRKMVQVWRCNAKLKKKYRIIRNIRNKIISRRVFNKWLEYTKESIAMKKADEYYRFCIFDTYFKRWRNWRFEKTGLERSDEDFPAIACQLSARAQNELLSWGYSRSPSLNISAYQYSQLRNGIEINNKKRFILNKLHTLITWSPLPLREKLQLDIDRPQKTDNIMSQSFKLLLLVDKNADSYLIEWVRTKFNVLDEGDVGKPLDLTLCLRSQHSGIYYYFVIVEKCLSFERPIKTDGASAIIALTHEKNLKPTVNSINASSKVPKIILCRNSSSNINSQDIWNMSNSVIEDASSSERLLQRVLDFWEWRHNLGCFYSKELRTVFDSVVTENVFKQVFYARDQRREFNQSPIPPLAIIELYNLMVDHLIKTIEDTNAKIDWPPPELSSVGGFPSQNWNSSERTDIIKRLKKIYLPKLTLKPGVLWKDLDVIIQEYVYSLSKTDYNYNLQSEINALIDLTDEDVENDPNIQARIPWPEFFMCCIFYKASQLPKMDLYFDPFILQSFQPGSCLDKINLDSMDLVKDSPRRHSKRKLESQVVTPTKQAKIHTCLMGDIKEEKQKSKDFEEELKKILEEDDDFLSRIFPDCLG